MLTVIAEFRLEKKAQCLPWRKCHLIRKGAEMCQGPGAIPNHIWVKEPGDAERHGPILGMGSGLSKHLLLGFPSNHSPGGR